MRTFKVNFLRVSSLPFQNDTCAILQNGSPCWSGRTQFFGFISHLCYAVRGCRTSWVSLQCIDIWHKKFLPVGVETHQKHVTSLGRTWSSCRCSTPRRMGAGLGGSCSSNAVIAVFKLIFSKSLCAMADYWVNKHEKLCHWPKIEPEATCLSRAFRMKGIKTFFKMLIQWPPVEGLFNVCFVLREK
jgi:hypothetical protein